MEVRIIVITLYFVSVLTIGFITRTRWKATPDEYFLAGRGLGTFVLLGTMTATNFSAFTVFGASGAGYRDGYAFFPIVGFGTGFMALTFWIVGKRIWQVGKARGIVSPAELVASLYNSRPLSVLFALVMVVFTIPYLALQPMAGGYVLSELFGMSQAFGATIITLVIVLYTFRGGMKAVAWTDVFQGLFMVTMMVTALLLVAHHFGGFTLAHEAIREIRPELLSRPGGQGRFGASLWFSFIMLWFFCDPMFPQLLQRFFSARSTSAIRRTMMFYPLICTLVFFLPVTLGVLGHLSFPGLIGKEADRILPLMMREIGGDFMGTLIVSAGLAALMSTMDSQLLTLSAIFTRDIYPLFRRTEGHSSMPGRLFVLALAAVGLWLAIRPWSTIIEIATQTFTGLAVLFPTVLFGLYSKKPRAAAGIISIVVGEILLVLYYLKLIPSGDFLPAVPIIAVTFLTYAAVGFLPSVGRVVLAAPEKRTIAFSIAFAGLFVLSIDWWQWDSSRSTLGGFPLWMGYFVFLSGVQTVLMRWWVRKAEAV